MEQDNAGKTNGVQSMESEVCGVVKYEPNDESSNALFDHRIVKDFQVFQSNAFGSFVLLLDGRFYFFVDGCFENSSLHLICLKQPIYLQ